MTHDNTTRSAAHRAERSTDVRRGERVPGRKTRPAYTDRRRTWFGWGQIGYAEKNVFGRFLHDLPYVFLEVFVAGLPAIWYIFATAPVVGFGVKDTGFVAWMTMIIVATLVHMGLVRPLATDTLGWVSITPTLVGLRVVYYNAALLAAAYGGVLVAGVTSPLIPVAVAAILAGVAMLAFPALAEAVARRRTR